MIGTRLGPYEITAKLGEGGMGEVYRATDTKLDRQVAIKVLPAAFTEDEARLSRFEREAKLLAQLHHPHIASIFGLEESDGTSALVMELVEGPTLSERLAAGPISVEEALPIARQIALALETAHEKGIIHRDLKPQNIKLTPEGEVKVLDFGLAKAMDPGGSSNGSPMASPTMMSSPTLTAMPGTQLGVILGTAAYMAPEQARGQAVDKRADIWAFGVVLYEMLAGSKLFASETVSDTLAAVIRKDVDLDELPAETPRAIRRLLRRCLERDPRNRLRDVGDARLVIDDLAAGRLEEPAAEPTPVSGRRAPWALLALGAAVGLLLGLLAGRQGSAPSREEPAVSTLLQIQPPEGSELLSGLALSPDGRKIAFVARDKTNHTDLWIRSLGSLEARKLPGTGQARYPFWAPDSRRLGFFADQSLKWIDSSGGTPLGLASTTTDVRGGAWGADDVLLYAPVFNGPIQAISVGGGEPRPATRLPEDGSYGTNRFPSFLPDGRRFIFYASAGGGAEPGDLFLGRVGSLEAKMLGPSSSAAVFADGHLLYVQADALVAHRFDDDKEELVGRPLPLRILLRGSSSVSGHRSVGAARGGTLIYRVDSTSFSQLLWVDRSGREVDRVTDQETAWHYAPRLSPDGRRAAVTQHTEAGGLLEIWVHDLERGLADRVTFGDGDAFVTVWSRPAGDLLLHNSAEPGGPGNLYRVDPGRPADSSLWLHGDNWQAPVDVTPDGRQVLVERGEPSGTVSLWLHDLEDPQSARRLGDGMISETSGSFSPDGQWLVYSSEATRKLEVYIRRLDGTGSAVRISTDGGSQPLWSPNGREIFYLDRLERLMTVPLGAGPEPEPGPPTPLFEPNLVAGSDRQYDVSADGQRFLINRSLDSGSTPITVVLDWTALLEAEQP